jgi:serine/threonine-protein kinase
VLAQALRHEADELLAGVEPWQPESAKAAAWAKQDQAAELERRAERTALEQEQLLQGSLTHAPALPEAHAALARRYRAQHAAAEANRRDTSRPEALLRQHASALPLDHTDRAAHLAYLGGDGALTLHTTLPDATVELYRFEPENRRLFPRHERTLGQTPLDGVPLARGSYLCVLRHPECEEVRYPVAIGRGEHWQGVAPGEEHPTPIVLPRRGSLGPKDCYVPAGWFQSGGDPDARDSLPGRRLWVEARVFRQDPVTNREYLAFLQALVMEGRTKEALRHAPRERRATPGELGALLCEFDGETFGLPRLSGEGETRWHLDWPVIMIDWDGARAYAQHEVARTGLPWRLPDELAWEKAARGVDGRSYPWGDAFDPSWACMKDSHRGMPTPSPLGAFPIDESVYGVQGLCGNVKDWCLEAWVPEGPELSTAAAPPPAAIEPGTSGHSAGLRVRRGGGWDSAPDTLRTATRDTRYADHRAFDMGFRLARSLTKAEEAP